jgi:hypothetical protein
MIMPQTLCATFVGDKDVDRCHLCDYPFEDHLLNVNDGDEEPRETPTITVGKYLGLRWPVVRQVITSWGEGREIVDRIYAKTEVEAKEWMEDHRPSWHCQHEYDCCGRFYPSSAELQPALDDATQTPLPCLWDVSQSWCRNV